MHQSAVSTDLLYVIYYPSHTRPSSLRTCVYEGVKTTSLSNASGVDISKLVNADIVLTTYDVLKEDLSHDSDRHEGDRRFMRFQKRFVICFCSFVMTFFSSLHALFFKNFAPFVQVSEHKLHIKKSLYYIFRLLVILSSSLDQVCREVLPPQKFLPSD